LSALALAGDQGEDDARRAAAAHGRHAANALCRGGQRCAGARGRRKEAGVVGRADCVARARARLAGPGGFASGPGSEDEAC
jgi:hypothetical protein